MKAPVFNIFMMHPPTDGKKKEKGLPQILREMMKISSEVQRMTGEVKNLPHSEHSGGGR